MPKKGKKKPPTLQATPYGSWLPEKMRDIVHTSSQWTNIRRPIKSEPAGTYPRSQMSPRYQEDEETLRKHPWGGGDWGEGSMEGALPFEESMPTAALIPPDVRREHGAVSYHGVQNDPFFITLDRTAQRLAINAGRDAEDVTLGDIEVALSILESRVKEGKHATSVLSGRQFVSEREGFEPDVGHQEETLAKIKVVRKYVNKAMSRYGSGGR